MTYGDCFCDWKSMTCPRNTGSAHSAALGWAEERLKKIRVGKYVPPHLFLPYEGSGLMSVPLTSAKRECLCTTSALFIGVSCCSTLRLFVRARVNRANFVQPAGKKEIVSEVLGPYSSLVNLLRVHWYFLSDLNGFSKLRRRTASGSRLKDLAKEEKYRCFKATTSKSE